MNRGLRRNLFFLLVLMAWRGFSQPGQLLFNHLTIGDGLSDATNAFIYKDSRGFVWIGSLLGLNRYDGHAVKTYIPDSKDPRALVGENIQSAFYEDRNHNLWFNTYEAIIEYDWKDDCFNQYEIKINNITQVGNFIFTLDSFDNIWLLNQDRVYKFNLIEKVFTLVGKCDTEYNRALPVENSDHQISEIWMYSLGEVGISRYVVKENKLVFVKSFSEGPSESPFLVRNIVSGPDNTLWFLYMNQLVKYNTTTGQKRSFSFGSKNAFTMEWLNQKTLLISFAEEGLIEFQTDRFELGNSYVHHADIPFSLLSNNVEAIYRDRDGGIWASSFGTGISFTYPQKKKFDFISLSGTNDNDMPAPIWLFLDSSDRVWCATKNDGCYWITKNDQSEKISVIPELESQKINLTIFYCLKDFDDQYWIGTFGKIRVYNSKTGKVESPGKAPSTIFSGVGVTPEFSLLSPGSNGVVEVRGNTQKGFTFAMNTKIPDSLQYTLLWFDGKSRLWANQQLERFIVMDSTTYQILDTINIRGWCHKIIESHDHQSYWIASSTGLYKVNAKGLQVESLDKEKYNVFHSAINGMEMDKNGRLWLTTNSDLIMFDPKLDSTRVFTQADGLPSLQFNSASVSFPNGEMWFGSGSGITRFHPDSVHDIFLTAYPIVTGIQINDRIPDIPLKCERTGTTNISETESLKLNYKHNTLSLTLSSLEFSDPAHTMIRYQMEGLDDHEIEIESGSQVRYPNMAPGNYRFLLYAYNSDHLRNPVPRIIHFRIIPPFYKTVWFYILMILLGGSIVGYIIYLRFTRTLELQKVRLKLYENLHDDVGSRLTAIVLSAENLERNENITHPKIQAISHIAKSIVGNMRRLVWAIDPENDRMQSIVQKINHDKSVLLGDAIELQIDIADHIQKLIIPGETRYQISSICSEAFNNILKYAKASKIWITFSLDRKQLRMTISDNGIGFNVEEKMKNISAGAGYGIGNMKRRASRVNGKLDIISKLGEGTRIECSFPL